MRIENTKFETCDKEKIYLGKQVLNSQILDEVLRKKLIRLK